MPKPVAELTDQEKRCRLRLLVSSFVLVIIVAILVILWQTGAFKSKKNQSNFTIAYQIYDNKGTEITKSALGSTKSFRMMTTAYLSGYNDSLLTQNASGATVVAKPAYLTLTSPVEYRRLCISKSTPVALRVQEVEKDASLHKASIWIYDPSTKYLIHPDTNLCLASNDKTHDVYAVKNANIPSGDKWKLEWDLNLEHGYVFNSKTGLYLENGGGSTKAEKVGMYSIKDKNINKAWMINIISKAS